MLLVQLFFNRLARSRGCSGRGINLSLPLITVSERSSFIMRIPSVSFHSQRKCMSFLKIYRCSFPWGLASKGKDNLHPVELEESCLCTSPKQPVTQGSSAKTPIDSVKNPSAWLRDIPQPSVCPSWVE